MTNFYFDCVKTFPTMFNNDLAKIILTFKFYYY